MVDVQPFQLKDPWPFACPWQACPCPWPNLGRSLIFLMPVGGKEMQGVRTKTQRNWYILIMLIYVVIICYHDYVFYIFSCGIWRKCRMAKPVHLRRARSILVLFSCEVMRTVKHIATTFSKGFASDEQVGSWEISRFAIPTGANWCGKRVGYPFFNFFEALENPEASPKWYPGKGWNAVCSTREQFPTYFVRNVQPTGCHAMPHFKRQTYARPQHSQLHCKRPRGAASSSTMWGVWRWCAVRNILNYRYYSTYIHVMYIRYKSKSSLILTNKTAKLGNCFGIS